MLNGDKFLEYIRAGKIPPGPPIGSSPGGWDSGLSTFDTSHRREVIAHGMWAIVDRIWTTQLAEWIGPRTCLEVMAGAGWLAKALAEQGVDIVATDNGEWDARHSKMNRVYEIEKLSGVEAVRKYSDREILIVSWPPCDDPAICQICNEWTYPIVYVGEGAMGCNAPEEFWKRFHIMENQPEFSLMSWYGLHNKVYIGTYGAEKVRQLLCE